MRKPSQSLSRTSAITINTWLSKETSMNYQQRHSYLSNYFMRLLGGGVLSILALATVTMAQSNLCIPQTDPVTGSPNIDGIVYGVNTPFRTADVGWTNAVRFNLNAGMGTSRTGLFQLVRTASDVYVSFVIDTPAPGVDDHIVIAFSTDTDPTHDWRIHIKPF